MQKIKKGDDAVVLAGKDKGKRGQITRVLANETVLVDGCNMAKKHVRPNPNTGEQGGIVEKEMPMHISNVGVYNPATGKADRVGIKTLEDGRKVRYFKSNNEIFDA